MSGSTSTSSSSEHLLSKNMMVHILFRERLATDSSSDTAVNYFLGRTILFLFYTRGANKVVVRRELEKPGI